MSKESSKKEEISFFKFWLGIFVATLLAIMGWMVTQFDNIGKLLFIASTMVCVCFAIAIVAISKIILKQIKKLEDIYD